MRYHWVRDQVFAKKMKLHGSLVVSIQQIFSLKHILFIIIQLCKKFIQQQMTISHQLLLAQRVCWYKYICICIHNLYSQRELDLVIMRSYYTINTIHLWTYEKIKIQQQQQLLVNQVTVLFLFFNIYLFMKFIFIVIFNSRIYNCLQLSIKLNNIEILKYLQRLHVNSTFIFLS